MNRLTSKRCNGIQRGYWSTAKKDELIQRLGRYEDTGLNPEDIKPIIHAHWIKEDEDKNSYFCSACGAIWMLSEGDPKDNGMHRCMNCGARMDEVEDEI